MFGSYETCVPWARQRVLVPRARTGCTHCLISSMGEWRRCFDRRRGEPGQGCRCALREAGSRTVRARDAPTTTQSHLAHQPSACCSLSTAPAVQVAAVLLLAHGTPISEFRHASSNRDSNLLSIGQAEGITEPCTSKSPHCCCNGMAS
jgi:hypothetical protein